MSNNIYDFYFFLKKERFERISWNKFTNNHNNYFWFSKRDRLYDNKPKDMRSLYFKNKLTYNLCFSKITIDKIDEAFTQKFSFKLILTSPLYTASENKFYSINKFFCKRKVNRDSNIKGKFLKRSIKTGCC